MERLRGQGHGPLGEDAPGDLPLEGRAVDRRGPCPGEPSSYRRCPVFGGARDGQGGGAHQVRRSRETEGDLLRWAKGVSCGAIRHKGDLAHRSIQETREVEKARSLSWGYFEENSRFGLHAELPAADG